MSKVILKAENISKQYRLGLVGTGTLRDDFKRGLARLRGKEDPFLKVGEVNDRSKKGNDDYVWALRDINFEVKQGEVLGIIGKNGAGKSTLLKILSQVTSPTTGRIKSRGRIASLLEVGTGFHPELTGRENIYLNGAILGMNKAEINSKLDEIIDFSGCERYIDTPVKRYSSGMTVRLGFAVAAHLEPEILVVDEVLAVGDAEFQKKAIGKMQDISQGEGRTVLFVSHNMASVQSLCTRGILLENGKVSYEGQVDKVISHYISGERGLLSGFDTFKNPDYYDGNDNFHGIYKVGIYQENQLSNNIEIGQDLKLKIYYKSLRDLNNAEVGFILKDALNVAYAGLNNIHLGKKIIVNKGYGSFELLFPKFSIYTSNFFKFDLFFGDENNSDYFEWKDACHFKTIILNPYNSIRNIDPHLNKIFLGNLEINHEILN